MTTMTTKTIGRRAPLLLLLLVACSMLLSCTTGPDPADVAADRDRWRAVRDVTADGRIGEDEAPLLTGLLVVWDEKLTADETAAGRHDPKAVLVDLLRVYGVAAVQVFLAPELKARAPDLFALVDVDKDGALSEAELLAIDPRSPVFAIVVASTVTQLLKKGH